MVVCGFFGCLFIDKNVLPAIIFSGTLLQETSKNAFCFCWHFCPLSQYGEFETNYRIIGGVLIDLTQKVLQRHSFATTHHYVMLLLISELFHSI